MGCCESTCMHNGSELVQGPDFKPLVLRHSEDPCPSNAGSASRSAAATAPASGNGGSALQARASVGTEGPRAVNAQSWTPVTLPPPPSSEVVQFRRLQYRELTPEDYDLLCLLDESLPKKNIAPPSLITSLPRVLARDCNATECHVCLSRLEPYTQVVPVPCGHAFHPECVSRWLTQCKGTCPLCMSPVDLVLDSASAQSHGQIAGASQHQADRDKDSSSSKLDPSVASVVGTIAAKKLARASFGRYGHFASRGASFDQPGSGDDSPAE